MHRFLFIILLFLLVGCHSGPDQAQRSVYYWRTVFRLTPSEQQFLRQHQVSLLYLRYFDVIPGATGEPVPTATLQFDGSFPQHTQIIPAVFIRTECIERGDLQQLARLIVRRVVQMTETNDVPHVSELQIDCDYTLRNRERYDQFLQTVRSEARRHHLKLSATIRLHQLSMPAPPVDRGVLMLYNTGDYRQASSRNIILDSRDVRPYMRYLGRYPLRLSAAFPNYSWTLLYRNSQFVGVLHGQQLSDATMFAPLGNDTYVAIHSKSIRTSIGGNSHQLMVQAGDTIRTVRSSMDEIRKVKKMLRSEQPDIQQEVIVYHLDENSIRQFNPKEYEEIYRP